MLDILDLELAAALAEIDLVALAARRGDGGDISQRKFAFGEDVEHFAPDIARRPCDHDPITHSFNPDWRRRPGA